MSLTINQTHHHSRLHDTFHSAYRRDKSMMGDTFEFGCKAFMAPVEATVRMAEATSQTRNPVTKFGGGVATCLTPFVVAPFSTTAAALTFCVALPALSAKAAVDKVATKLS